MNSTNELRSARLTKKFLMSLPNGIYLMSNLLGQSGNSIFGKYILSPLYEREKQWQRIKRVGANNHLCRLFKTESQANAWIDKITNHVSQ